MILFNFTRSLNGSVILRPQNPYIIDRQSGKLKSKFFTRLFLRLHKKFIKIGSQKTLFFKLFCTLSAVEINRFQSNIYVYILFLYSFYIKIV